MPVDLETFMLGTLAAVPGSLLVAALAVVVVIALGGIAFTIYLVCRLGSFVADVELDDSSLLDRPVLGPDGDPR
jgi:hypothetical protein